MMHIVGHICIDQRGLLCYYNSMVLLPKIPEDITRREPADSTDQDLLDYQDINLPRDNDDRLLQAELLEARPPRVLSSQRG